MSRDLSDERPRPDAEALARINAAVKLRREQRAAEEAQELVEAQRAIAEGLVSGARRAYEEAQLLACFDGMASDPSDVQRAVNDCYRLDGRNVQRGSGDRWGAGGCPRAALKQCPRTVEREALYDFAGQLFASRIPGAIDTDGGNRLERLLRSWWVQPGTDASAAELLLATARGLRRRDGTPVESMPLQETEPVQLVRAFLSRKPAEVQIGARRVELTGEEWALVLGGDMATGKTVGACSAVIERRVLFAAAPELVEHEPLVTKRQAEEAPLLVLDDLGTERNAASQFAVETLGDILVTRHRHRRLVIVTTNLTVQRRKPGDEPGLRERYGDRLFDSDRGRWREGMVLVGFKGSSLR